MRSYLLKTAFFILFFACRVAAQNDSIADMRIYNFSSFTTSDAQVKFKELNVMTPVAYQSHPEYGKLPYNTQCKDCYELIDKRTISSRRYAKNGTFGQTFYVETCYGDLNYVDLNGDFIAIDPRLLPSSVMPKVYQALHQPQPTKVDMNDGSTSIQLLPFELKLNSAPRIMHVTTSGETQVFGNLNISNSTVGDDGAMTTDAFNTIDREVKVDRGIIETSYIIKTLPVIPNQGWLAFEDKIDLPPGYSIVYDTVGSFNTDGYWLGDLRLINTSSNAELARWSSIFVHDADTNLIDPSAYQIINTGNTYYVRSMVPVPWLLSGILTYPVVVDPLVSGTATWSAGIIGFSEYTAGGPSCASSTTYCTGGPLNVTFPGQATITNVTWSCNFQNVPPNKACQAGMRMVGPCGEDPVSTTSYWACGTCTGVNFCNSTIATVTVVCTDVLPSLANCLTPLCASSILPFYVKNYRCVAGTVSCATNRYFTVNNTWIVTVEGQTVNQPSAPVSSAGTTICPFACTNLTATGQYGVPPYTYAWSPGGSTANPLTVCPTTSTTYTCVITDACGNTSSNSVAITTSGCLPISILTFNATELYGSVYLNWSTASEINNDFFTVERSPDGIHFEPIATVKGAGTSSEVHNYSSVDERPMSGYSYYRLKQTDYNGQVTYSEIRSVSVEPIHSELTVQPNPANTIAYFNFMSDADGQAVIKVYDATAKFLFSKITSVVPGMNSVGVDVSSLARGFYFTTVTIQGDGKVKRTKFAHD